MALSTARISEIRLQLPPQFFSSYSAAPRKHCFSLFFLKPLCSSLPPAEIPRKSLRNLDIVKPTTTTTKYSSSWLNKWPSQNPLPPVHYKDPKTIRPELDGTRVDDDSDPPRTSAIERIVLRLRNLGLGTDDDDEDDEIAEPGIGRGGDDVGWMNVEENLGDLLRRDWVRPDKLLADDKEDPDSLLLPWERGAEGGSGGESAVEVEASQGKKRAPKAGSKNIEQRRQWGWRWVRDPDRRDEWVVVVEFNLILYFLIVDKYKKIKNNLLCPPRQIFKGEIGYSRSWA